MSNQQGYWRLPALQTLAMGLSVSAPLNLTNGLLVPGVESSAFAPSGVAVIVEERQDLLGEALDFVAHQVSIFGDVPVMAVGVRRHLPNSSSVHCCGLGSDAEKMQHVTRCIREGRLGREVYLLTEPLRAQWWASAFGRQAALQRLHCSSYAASVRMTSWSEERLLEHDGVIVDQALKLMQEMNDLGIDPVRGFEPGGEYHQALEHLLK